MSYSKECIKIIDYLVSKGKKRNSFAEAFPYIHHFRGKIGDDSLQGFYEYCQSCEIEKPTNMNVYHRLLIIKRLTAEFIENNQSVTGVSSIKYQRFAKQSIDEVPFS
jgi:hypothetical protein